MNRPRILVVEDQVVVARDIKLRLESLGYTPIGDTGRGEEAIEMARKSRPDLVLMDIRLKDEMDGIEAAKKIRALTQTPVVFLTAYAEDSTLHRAKLAEPYGYIIKPFEDREIRTVIEMAIYKHSTEQQLRASEERYRAVIETSADGFCMIDMEGRLLEVNDAYIKLSGYSREELLAMRFADLEAQETAAESKGRFEKVKASGSGLFETYQQAKCGMIWQAEIDVSYWPISEGRFFVFVRDIHRRKRSERLLRTRLELSGLAVHSDLQSVMQAALDGAEVYTGSRLAYLHFVDAKGEEISLQAWSRNTLRECKATPGSTHYPADLAGAWGDCLRTKAPVIHNDFSTLPNRRGVPEGHPELVRDLAVPVIENGVVQAIMGVGNKFVDYTEEDVQVVSELASIVMDLVARKKAEQNLADSNEQLKSALDRLQKAQQQLVAQERLRALGQMASGIAHDFNNALSPILGFAEMLIQEPEQLADQARVLEYLQIIHQSANDAAQIVRGLREFYRPLGEGEVFAPISVEHMVKRALQLTKPRWKQQAEVAGITFELNVELGSVDSVLGDEPSLREALTNLVFNALDAMPTGGTLSLRSRQENQHVVLEVGDTGVGMTEEIRQRCLEPFFSTKGEHGSGLGLAMVHGIISRHSGVLEVDSAPGRGTTFRIRLPRAQTSQTAGDDVKARKKPTISRRILLADDDQKVREVLRDFLRLDNHNVTLAANGNQALDAFDQEQFDLVITDHAMPGMSGDQFAALLKRRAPGIPVILLTGFGEVMNAQGDCPPHVDLVVPKPVTVKQLREAIEKVLQRN